MDTSKVNLDPIKSIPGLPLREKTETKFDNIKGYVLSFMAYNKYTKENSHGKSC